MTSKLAIIVFMVLTSGVYAQVDEEVSLLSSDIPRANVTHFEDVEKIELKRSIMAGANSEWDSFGAIFTKDSTDYEASCFYKIAQAVPYRQRIPEGEVLKVKRLYFSSSLPASILDRLVYGGVNSRDWVTYEFEKVKNGYSWSITAMTCDRNLLTYKNNSTYFTGVEDHIILDLMGKYFLKYN